MPRVNLSTQVAALTAQVADLQRDLELTQRQLQDCLTEKGALLSQNAALKDEVSTCHDELAKLEAAVESYAHRCDALEELLASKSKIPAKPKSPAPKPQVPVSELEAQPVVQITDADKRVWAAFNSLPREKRQSYYEFARATVGHLGIHNIAAVREAYLAKQAV